jgi:hypothetical protein
MSEAAVKGNCCLPGDITVTKIPTGYLLGRATKPVAGGRGPWWEYVATVSKYDDAVHQAQTIARMEGVCAWLHKRDDEYDRLWPEPKAT